MANKNQIKVEVSLTGLQEYKAGLKGIATATKDLQSDFKNLGDAVTESAKRFAAIGAAIVGVTTALVGLTAKNAATAEEISNLSKVSGNSVEELQVFRQIAADAGLSTEAAGKALVRLTKNVEELRDPTSATSKEINNLAPGLRGALLAAENSDERFNILRSTLSGITDESKAVNIAQLLLGKAGAELLPVLQLTNKEYETSRQRLEELGFVLNDTQNQALANFDTAFDDAGTAVAAFGKQVSADLAQPFADAINVVVDFYVANRRELQTFLQFLITEASAVVRGFYAVLTGQEVSADISENARRIIEGFRSIKDAVVGAFQVTVPILKSFYAVLDTIAKLIGFESGGQLGLTIAFLQLTGVIRVFFAAVAVARSTFLLFVAALKLGPPALTLLAATFTAQGGLITKAVAGIQAAWTVAMAAMRTATLSFAGVLTALRTAAAAAWIALTGPVGLAVAGIAAVIAILAVVVEKTIGWKNVWESLKAVFQSVGQVAGQVLRSIGDFFIGLGVLIRTGVSAAVTIMVGLFKAGFDQIKTFFAPVLQFIEQQVVSRWKVVVDTITNAIRTAVNALKTAIDPILNGITNFISRVSAAIKSITSLGSQTRIQSDMQERQKKNPQAFGPGFARGGYVRGPGTTTSDSFYAPLSDKEYVVRAASVKKYGKPLLDAINSGAFKLKGFAQGGLATLEDTFSGLSSPSVAPALVPVQGNNQGSNLRPINFYLPGGGSIPAMVDIDVAKRLEREMRQSDIAKSSKDPRWKR